MSDLLQSRSAVFHEENGVRTHRYRLTISIGRGPHVAMVGVNPSEADELKNDPTMAKVVGFGARLGWGQVSMLNKFAAIDKDVRALRSMEYARAIGEFNIHHFEAVFDLADIIVAAWGPLAKLPAPFRNRWRDVVGYAQQAGKPLMCLGTAKDGHPRHPLMLAYSTPLIEWKVPA